MTLRLKTGEELVTAGSETAIRTKLREYIEGNTELLQANAVRGWCRGELRVVNLEDIEPDLEV